MISDRIAKDIPPQMNILDMVKVIPLLMHLINTSLLHLKVKHYKHIIQRNVM